MQRLPGHVLQELQQQGEEQTQHAYQQSRAAGEGRGGGGLAATPPLSPRPPSLPLSTEDRPHAIPPSARTPPLSFQADRPQRVLRTSSKKQPATSSRRRTVSSDEPLGQTPTRSCVRGGAGPRTDSPPPWSRSAETPSPELLGRSLGPDADLLTDGADRSVNLASRHDSPREPSTAQHSHALLSPDSSPPQDIVLNPSLRTHEELHHESITPESSSSAHTRKSAASRTSIASSFAPFLTNRRVDDRLFKSSTKPSQHHTKRSSKVHTTPKPIKRTLSSSRPKVVEDTSTFQGHQLSLHDPRSYEQLAATIYTPQSPRSFSPPPYVRKLHSTGSSDRMRAASPPAVAPPGPVSPKLTKALKRPSIVRTTTLEDVSFLTAPLRQVRIEMPAHDELAFRSRSRDSTQTRPRGRARESPSDKQHLEHKSDSKRYRTVTPPNVEPRTPMLSAIDADDSYFRDTTCSTGMTPIMAQTQSDQPLSEAFDRPEAPVKPKASSDMSHFGRSKRKRSSVFRAFRRTAVTDSISEASRSDMGGTSPLSAAGVTFSDNLQRPIKRRRPSVLETEPQLPPYFARPGRRRNQRSSEATPSSGILTIASSGSDLSPLQRHHRSRSSEDLSTTSPPSPLSKPGPRSRLRGPRTLADINDADTDAPVVPTDAGGVPAEPSSAAIDLLWNQAPAERKIRVKSSPSIQIQAKCSPSHTQPDVTQSVAKVRDIQQFSFKSFVSDLWNSSPWVKDKKDVASAEATQPERRKAIASKSSFTKLLETFTKPQTKKLQRKASHATVSTTLTCDPKYLIPESSLEVTNFQQTPFSQRYGNTKRAEMTQIRSFLQEMLNDDNDDTQLGFEFDVPDHLPNSPLCPLSPKHKSGGKAICPLHGRKKKVGGSAGDKKGKTAIRRKPTIVYEGGIGEAEKTRLARDWESMGAKIEGD